MIICNFDMFNFIYFIQTEKVQVCELYQSISTCISWLNKLYCVVVTFSNLHLDGWMLNNINKHKNHTDYM